MESRKNNKLFSPITCLFNIKVEEYDDRKVSFYDLAWKSVNTQTQFIDSQILTILSFAIYFKDLHNDKSTYKLVSYLGCLKLVQIFASTVVFPRLSTV